MSKATARYFEFGAFRVDTVKRRLLRDGQLVPLTAKVFDTLLALVESPGEVIEKDDLMQKVWADSFVEEGNLTQNISVLRKALGESPGEYQYIATVPRIGYRFVATVQRLADERAEAPRQPPDSAPPLTIPAIAVLPFQLFASDSGDEYLGLGMADALITRLSNIRQVIVRPTSAVLKYGQAGQDLAAIGQALRVGFVLEGSIRKAGARIRATVQLVSAADGRSLWAERFDEPFTDLFTVEDAIAEKMALALALRLSRAERERLTTRYTKSLEAYEFYLKGRYYANKFTLENFSKGIECFNRALELDPDYALAYAGIAEAYWIAADLYLNATEAYPKVREAAIKAIEIDDHLAEAHTFLAVIKMNDDWDWAQTESEFRRAIELNCGYAPTHHWYGWYLTLMGRHQEAITELELAKQLDPFSVGINWFHSAVLGLARRYDEALEKARALIELEPNFWGGHWALGFAHTYKGELSEAIAAYQKAGELDASPMIKGALAHVYALAGKRDAARALLNELQALETEAYVPPYYLAFIHLALAAPDEAFDYLEKAYAMRDGNLPLIKVDPRLDSARADPRLADLRLRMGLSN